MKTIKEAYPNIKEESILIDKNKQEYKVTNIFVYTIQVSNDYENIYSFNTRDIKQMKLKVKQNKL